MFETFNRYTTLVRHHPTLHAEVDQDIVHRFVERDGECFGFGKPSETKRQLPEVAQILTNLVRRYRETAAADLEGYRLMARVFDEQCETVSEEADCATIQVKAPAAIPSDTVHPVTLRTQQRRRGQSDISQTDDTNDFVKTWQTVLLREGIVGIFSKCHPCYDSESIG